MRRYKPKIAKAENQRDQFFVATEALVSAIENLKKDYPDDWNKHLEPLIKKYIADGGVADTVIRTIRGLAAKV